MTCRTIKNQIAYGNGSVKQQKQKAAEATNNCRRC